MKSKSILHKKFIETEKAIKNKSNYNEIEEIINETLASIADMNAKELLDEIKINSKQIKYLDNTLNC